ncbi:hypothetical protein BURKHO8Y_210624 [Burkholderia sp. 8Y]|nr:hypothetical protein BURKHO8Y_210624 [Burkholderia sp. 8Y]
MDGKTVTSSWLVNNVAKKQPSSKRPHSPYRQGFQNNYSRLPDEDSRLILEDSATRLLAIGSAKLGLLDCAASLIRKECLDEAEIA